MRTTLDIDQDVMAALRHVAPKRGISMGKLASELIRKALDASEAPPMEMRAGVPVITKQSDDAELVTRELIDRIRDEIDD